MRKKRNNYWNSLQYSRTPRYPHQIPSRQGETNLRITCVRALMSGFCFVWMCWSLNVQVKDLLFLNVTFLSYRYWYSAILCTRTCVVRESGVGVVDVREWCWSFDVRVVLECWSFDVREWCWSCWCSRNTYVPQEDCKYRRDLSHRISTVSLFRHPNREDRTHHHSHILAFWIYQADEQIALSGCSCTCWCQSYVGIRVTIRVEPRIREKVTSEFESVSELRFEWYPGIREKVLVNLSTVSELRFEWYPRFERKWQVNLSRCQSYDSSGILGYERKWQVNLSDMIRCQSYDRVVSWFERKWQVNLSTVSELRFEWYPRIREKATSEFEWHDTVSELRWVTW